MSSLDDSLESAFADAECETLRARVKAMVELRVAKWDGIELHESAFVPSTSPDETTTQQTLSPEEQQRRARLERERLMMSSSGGPVRRLSATGK